MILAVKEDEASDIEEVILIPSPAAITATKETIKDCWYKKYMM